VSGPKSVRVRMYQVGFGDCFLVSFEYPGEVPGERHMLIDFGRKYKPHAGGDMLAVAKDIKARTGRQLDVVVVSHRHADHLSAFGSSGIAQLIEDCDPKLVVRSWTEDPLAPEIAPGHAVAGPGTAGSGAGPARPSLWAADRRFVSALNAASGLAQEIAGSRFAQ
jgi:glyoxylase-like metal-dependent hydrolase (beta-lactamase superfamily II)